MKLELLGWKCEGLRCPDFSFDLKRNKNSKAAFVQMPNGTGKTTTLNMLKKTMYEHIFKSSEVIEVEAKIPEEKKKKGFFQSKLSLDGKIFYVTIKLDFENKSYLYESSLSDEGGLISGFKLPEEIENFIDKELIDLLFVDLEEDVSPMFRSHQTGAREAIRKLCKISLLQNLMNDFESYKNKKRKENIKSGSLKREIETEEARLSKIENKISLVEKKVEEFKNFLNNTEKEYINGKNELDKILNSEQSTSNKLRELEKKCEETKTSYEEILAINLDTIKNIGSYDNLLKTELNTFVKNLDDMGLPEEEVRVFFNKILSKDMCICGEELDDKKRQVISKAMESFISQEEAGVISKIKAAVDENLKKEKIDLNENSKKIQEYKQQYDVLKENIELTKRNALKENIELSEKIKKLEKERKEKEIFLNQTIIEDWKAKHNEENTESLTSLKEQKKLIEKKLADLSGTRDIEEKVNFLNQIIEDAMHNAEDQISKEITQECNKKIDIMFVKNPIYIKSINKYIQLDGQSGGSTGQEARIGIIFLLTLLERSKIQFPLIIDVPVKGMDNAARRRTARFISDLESQFLCFVIDSDKEHFTDEIHKIDGNNNTFITAFRRSKEFDKLVENNSSSNDTAYTSHNGQVVHGYNFFTKFTEDEDRDGI